MKFGSVCSGIEAASTAWNPIGWEAAWFAEIEPFPCAVLKHHFPDVPNLGDMTTIATRILTGEVEAPDVFTGGTPCQAFSVAGLRQSLSDDRGNLSLKFVEIADAIDHIRGIRGDDPAIIIWENVPGVLSTKDNAFGCFLGELAGESVPLDAPGGKWSNAGCVYGPQRAVAWRTLDAQFFGVAQRRRRVFVVASARDGFDPAAVLFEFDGVRRDAAPSRKTGQEVAGTISSRTTGGGGLGTDFDLAGGIQRWPADIAPTLDAHYGDKMGLENQHINGGGGCSSVAKCLITKTRLDTETETLIPTIGGRFSCDPIALAENTIGRQPENDGNGDGFTVGGPMYTLNATGVHGVAQPIAFAQNSRDEVRLMNGDGQIVGALSAEPGMKQTCYVAQPIAFHANAQADQLPTASRDTSVSDSLTARHDSSPRADRGMNVIAFSAKDSGADATEDLSPTLRAMGHSGSHANGGGQMAVVHTLRGEGFDASEDGTGRGTPIVPVAYSFDSLASNSMKSANPHSGCRQVDLSKTIDSTDPNPSKNQGGIAIQQSMQVRRLTPTECERLQGFPDGYTNIPWRGKPESPDGPRYKALGNSWAVPVVRWIGERINQVEAIK